MSSISRGLHNNHNVYILGAGFSKLQGLPLISDFMTQMRDALQFHAEHHHRAECLAIEQVLEFRLKASAAAYRVQIDLENIEELFSLASASLGQPEENIKLAIAATLDYAISRPGATKTATFRALHSDISPLRDWGVRKGQGNEKEGAWTAPAYQYILRALMGDWGNEQFDVENSFITFNYDTLVEEALDGLGVSYSLGFPESEESPETQQTKVLKLHGSVNWAVPKHARTRFKPHSSYREVVKLQLVPQIIPPTWKKDSKGAFDDIWSSALRALSAATRVVVVGFSIPPTDLHFKYLLAAGLRENYSLREIVFVNPSPGLEEVKRRSESLFANQAHNAAKVRFVDATIEQFVGQGTSQNAVWSIGRPLPESIQMLQF